VHVGPCRLVVECRSVLDDHDAVGAAECVAGLGLPAEREIQSRHGCRGEIHVCVWRDDERR
jgi:hypothetical protein